MLICGVLARLSEREKKNERSRANGMVFSVGVSGVSGDEVADPSECATAAYPKPGRDD